MKLSVITINRNNADGLRRTMQSVLCQASKQFEYVVIDGASTDDSVSVMNEFCERFSEAGVSVNAVSEPDGGLYNAMNKGLAKAIGEYVIMLNSGDEFVDSKVISSILPILDGTDIVQGNILRLKSDGQHLDRGYGRSEIDFLDVQKGHFLHQASFCRRDLFDRCGMFDESYRIDGDTVFYIKALGYGDASFKYIDRTIALFDCGGRSSAENVAWSKARSEEFERWSTELFSHRLWNTCLECDSKVRLYDKLRRHPFLWKVTMLLSRVANWLES